MGKAAVEAHRHGYRSALVHLRTAEVLDRTNRLEVRTLIAAINDVVESNGADLISRSGLIDKRGPISAGISGKDKDMATTRQTNAIDVYKEMQNEHVSRQGQKSLQAQEWSPPRSSTEAPPSPRVGSHSPSPDNGPRHRRRKEKESKATAKGGEKEKRREESRTRDKSQRKEKKAKREEEKRKRRKKEKSAKRRRGRGSSRSRYSSSGDSETETTDTSEEESDYRYRRYERRRSPGVGDRNTNHNQSSRDAGTMSTKLRRDRPELERYASLSETGFQQDERNNDIIAISSQASTNQNSNGGRGERKRTETTHRPRRRSSEELSPKRRRYNDSIDVRKVDLSYEDSLNSRTSSPSIHSVISLDSASSETDSHSGRKAALLVVGENKSSQSKLCIDNGTLQYRRTETQDPIQFSPPTFTESGCSPRDHDVKRQQRKRKDGAVQGYSREGNESSLHESDIDEFEEYNDTERNDETSSGGETPTSTRSYESVGSTPARRTKSRRCARGRRSGATADSLAISDHVERIPTPQINIEGKSMSGDDGSIDIVHLPGDYVDSAAPHRSGSLSPYRTLQSDFVALHPDLHIYINGLSPASSSLLAGISNSSPTSMFVPLPSHAQPLTGAVQPLPPPLPAHVMSRPSVNLPYPIFDGSLSSPGSPVSVPHSSSPSTAAIDSLSGSVPIPVGTASESVPSASSVLPFPSIFPLLPTEPPIPGSTLPMAPPRRDALYPTTRSAIGAVAPSIPMQTFGNQDENRENISGGEDGNEDMTLPDGY